MLRTYQEIRDKVNELARESLLNQLPERARPQFLAEYEAVAEAAPERLQEFLHQWWMKAFES
ncbi:hypothetical protein GCM10009555_048780 [Acrocarpospora macrocephala]|uniref:Uncharacterized protein n=1 Tax=Acrocarpospora macrocephala TaxID=150177 RepID=A0A5M3X3G1_9ACTN|nr:hypothetical protein [Acrocarpospora macrocephala]GES14639.1 hypothetical protein Amac_082360 [Acrocarpospora macrocephala]